MSPDWELSAPLAALDPVVADLVAAEAERQQDGLNLVASENLAPLAVLEAQGSVLSDKYADGYPARREYDGCENVDALERLAIERAMALFGAEHANVQPYSGSNANAAVLSALCEPGDGVLGFSFEHGGHPSHYAPECAAGRYYRAVSYGVSAEDFLVDYDEVASLAHRHQPKVIFAGWSCYSRHLDFAAFRAIADEVGASLVCDMAHFAGLVAAGLHPDPLPYADACTLTLHKTLGGARGGMILCRRELAAAIDAAVYPGDQGGPLMHVIAGKAVSLLVASSPAFSERMARTIAGARAIAAQLNAAEEQTGCLVRTGGTDVHQLHLDTSASERDARSCLESLHEVGISANAMRIAYDKAQAPACSGLRLGATSLATRGYCGEDFERLGALVAEALSTRPRRPVASIAGEVAELAAAHRVAC